MKKQKTQHIMVDTKNGNLLRIILLSAVTATVFTLASKLLALTGIPDWLDFLPQILLVTPIAIGTSNAYFYLFERRSFDWRNIIAPFCSLENYKNSLIISAVIYAAGLPVRLVISLMSKLVSNGIDFDKIDVSMRLFIGVCVLLGLVLVLIYAAVCAFFLVALKYRWNAAVANESGKDVLQVSREVIGTTLRRFFHIFGRSLRLLPIMLVVMLLCAVLSILTLNGGAVAELLVLIATLTAFSAVSDVYYIRLQYLYFPPETTKKKKK